MRRRKIARSIAQSMVEYAIIAALIAVVALVAVRSLGSTVAGVFDNVTHSVQSVDVAGATAGGH